jgi:hypothetical protein
MTGSEDVWEAINYCYEKGWAADGLPVVPPTEEQVRRFVEYVGREGHEVVARMEPVGRQCTVEKAAVNAVMAGCLREYFPVVLAALEALEDERYHFHGSTASTGGCAPLLVVNGPIRKHLEINSGVNVFGPGFRANATIGRTIRLIQLNVFGMYPGVFDQSTQGFPGKYSLCIAENEEESPWEPLHVEQGLPADSSAVTVWGARSMVQVQQRRASTPEGVLLTIVATMCQLGSIQLKRQTTVVMGPEHANLIGRHGWSKTDVKEFLHQNTCRPIRDFEISKDHQNIEGREVLDSPEFMPMGQVPDDILLVVAGGNNAGVSTVLHPWGHRFSSAVGASPPAGTPSMDYVTKPIRES